MVTIPTEPILRLLTDRRLFIEELLQIEDKQRRITPFKLNDIQSDFYAMLDRKGARRVVLKPSQVGFSTLVIAYFLVDTITTAGTTSVIVAHEEFITQRLLRKAHFFLDNLPDDFKPKLSHRSANELLFPAINSVMYIGSSRAYVFGRGEAIHNFLADEYAFWADPERIMVPALQRVTPEGRLVVVSTPNGKNNPFYDLYQEGKRGRSSWRSKFYPWYDHVEYRLGPGDAGVLSGDDQPMLSSLTSDEEALLQRGLTHDQIRWRRAKKAELEALRRDGSTRLLFGQEYPEDDVTCFITSGESPYDLDVLLALVRQTVPALRWREQVGIWEEPKDAASYIVGVDPGLGKQTNSAITVWRFDRTEDGQDCPIHCATYAGLLDTGKTAKKAVEVGHWYNTATLAVEANGHGLAVLSELVNVYRYPRLYYRRDIVSGRESREPGWLTTPRTKPTMVKDAIKLLPRTVCKDIRIIDEFANVRIEGDHTVSVGLDDLHMSTLIAWICRQAAPVGRGLVGRSGWPDDWGNR